MIRIVAAIALALVTAAAGGPSESGSTTVRVKLPSGVELEIVEAPFRGSGIPVKGCTPSALVCRVGGKPYGMATGLPTTYLKSVTASYAGSKFKLDCSGIYDADVKGHSVQKPVRYFGGSCQGAKDCRLRALLSDAVNTIAVEWVVFDGVAERQIISFDDDIIGLFLKNIDPPVYE